MEKFLFIAFVTIVLASGVFFGGFIAISALASGKMDVACIFAFVCLASLKLFKISDAVKLFFRFINK
jgi:hypothetical protein